MRSTITLHFVSSFVRRVTYLKISPIGLHLAEKKNELNFEREQQTTTTDVTFKEALNYSPRQKFCRGQKLFWCKIEFWILWNHHQVAANNHSWDICKNTELLLDFSYFFLTFCKNAFYNFQFLFNISPKRIEP